MWFISNKCIQWGNPAEKRLRIPLSSLSRVCCVSDSDLCLKRTKQRDEKPLRGSTSLSPREALCAALPLAASERDDVMLLRRAGMGFRRTSQRRCSLDEHFSVFTQLQQKWHAVFLMQCFALCSQPDYRLSFSHATAEVWLCRTHKRTQQITVRVQKE